MIDMAEFVERARVEGNFLVTGYNQYEKRILRNIEPSYDLGYVFGSYLSVGSVNIITYKRSKRGIVFWYIEKSNSSDKLSKLKNSVKKSFNLSLNVREQKKASTYQIACYSKPLATLLSQLGKKSGNKKLPECYMIKNNKEYNKGIIDAIEDFEGHIPDRRDVLKKRKLSLDVVDLYQKLKNY